MKGEGRPVGEGRKLGEGEGRVRGPPGRRLREGRQGKLRSSRRVSIKILIASFIKQFSCSSRKIVK